jgi:serine protease AprX
LQEKTSKRMVRARLRASRAVGQVLQKSLVIVTLLGSISAAQAQQTQKLSLDLSNSIQAADSRTVRAQQVLGNRIHGLLDHAAPIDVEAPRFRVIVRSQVPVTRTLRQRFIRSGAVVGRTFASLGTAVVEATPEQILALTKDPNVVSISPDRAISSSAELNVNLQAAGADVMQQSPYVSNRPLNGNNIGVAVLDSGVAPVGDLANRITGFRDFVNNQTEPYDDFGHGTHVAGIIAGSGAASSGDSATQTFRGVAPSANIIGVKVLSGNGSGSLSNVIAGIDWCIANRQQLRIRVINLSLGGGVFESYKTDPLCQAAERAVASGIVVVASAGNWGGVYGGVGTPANDPLVIAVGASNTRGTVNRNDDVITTYTGRGPSRFDLSVKPDLLAPGNKIVSLRAPGSTIDTQFPESRVPVGEYLVANNQEQLPATAYTRLSGTSMAAPLVTGTAALLIQTNQQLRPNGVKAALLYSAQLLTGYDPVRLATVTYDPFTQGAGQLNIPGAVEMAVLMHPNGLQAAPTMTSTIGGASVAWAGSTIPALLQRTNGVWNNNLLTTSAAWAGSTLWNNNVRWTEDLVWAGNVVWGGTTADPPIGRAFMVPDDPDVIWSQSAIWGGLGVISDDNLFLNGEASGLPVNANTVWGSNVVWGGTTADPPIGLVNGDDTANPFGVGPGS